MDQPGFFFFFCDMAIIELATSNTLFVCRFCYVNASLRNEKDWYNLNYT